MILQVFLIIAGDDLLSQDVQSGPVRQQAFEAFSRGDFKNAYSGFSELLNTYSKDPLYKYYSGVCLVHLEQDPHMAAALLSDATSEANIVRAVPSDVLFWLGRAYQQAGDYSSALSSFNKYSETAGKKEIREMNVSQYIKECSENRGALADSKPKEAEISPLPDNYDNVLSEALVLQNKADSAARVADEIKKTSSASLEPDNEEAEKRIIDAETIAASFQKKADEKYDEAHTIADANTVETDVVPEMDASDSNRIESEAEKSQDVTSPLSALASFRVVDKPVFDLNEKIEINPQTPEGLIYRIQVAVFRNEVAPSYFKGITPVYGFRDAGVDRTNYYAGMFRRKDDASKALIQVRQKGFRDAFIVAFSGAKIISADRAAVLEKEWGEKSFIDGTEGTGGNIVDTLPPTLSFRVEITRSQKPLSVENEDNFRKLAASRGLDIWQLSDGTIVYLIGKFITFDSAEEYASLLSRNGYHDAKVGAWLGRKEIPVETARQLFEKFE
jgi:tetratricopeptide (TPR) repeat protein